MKPLDAAVGQDFPSVPAMSVVVKLDANHRLIREAVGETARDLGSLRQAGRSRQTSVRVDA